MSAGKQQMMTAFWGMVINNYTETHLALLRQAYPDHIRKLVYTLEKGESGTPHVQAYIRLFRQQRLSYVKKLFPSANFRALTSDEYILNAESYAQKLDHTAESPAAIVNNQLPDPVSELLSVIRDVYSTYALDNTYATWSKMEYRTMVSYKDIIERQRVVERPHLARFYVSTLYERVWATYGRQLMFHVCHEQLRAESETHTHTHTQRELISRAGGITNDASEQDSEDQEGEHSPRQVQFEGEDSEDEDADEADGSGSEEHCEGDDDEGSGDEIRI